MKNILFDLISTQGSANGGSEYTKRILTELLLLNNINIIGVYDSRLPSYSNEIECIIKVKGKLVDIREYELSIANIIRQFNIETFFIGIIQRYFSYNLININCQVVAIMHDVGDLENSYNELYKFYPEQKISKKKRIFNLIKGDSSKNIFEINKTKYLRILPFLKSNNVKLFTVSKHSSSTIRFFFDELINKKIDILYPPLKTTFIKDCIENIQLREFINSKKKYFLVISAHRKDKNAHIVYKAFSEFVKSHPDYYLICIGGQLSIPNCLNLPLLSTSDLEYAYKYAFAFIYPSLQEGFGYPPLEAMKYNVPTICANVCSMPEIYEDSVLMFSPFYANDLYKQMSLIISNRDILVEKISRKYKSIIYRQEKDLNKLISNIINNE